MGTLLVALSHPDDEVSCAGTIAAHRARGDRVVLLWLTRGELSSALGELSPAEVARRRVAHGEAVARLLGCEPRFLDLPDTRVEATAELVHRLAGWVAEFRPAAVLTWGDAWVRGMRHPDHQATGRAVRGAVTLARIPNVVAPRAPHREPAPVFTLRDVHSSLPERAVDVSAHVERVLAVGRYYRERVGWPEEGLLERRLAEAGRRYGVSAAETFDAWESAGGLGAGLV